jgi:predicted transcriptional regulator
MQIVYRLGEASAADVADRMEESPGYDSVRVTLGILARKGYVTTRQEGRRNIYVPTVPREEASRSATRSLLQNFFGGSPSKAILTLLDESTAKLSKDELDRIADWLDREKQS